MRVGNLVLYSWLQSQIWRPKGLLMDDATIGPGISGTALARKLERLAAGHPPASSIFFLVQEVFLSAFTERVSR